MEFYFANRCSNRESYCFKNVKSKLLQHTICSDEKDFIINANPVFYLKFSPNACCSTTQNNSFELINVSIKLRFDLDGQQEVKTSPIAFHCLC